MATVFSSPVNVLVVQRPTRGTAILTFCSMVKCNDTCIFGVYTLLIKCNDYYVQELPAIESAIPASDLNAQPADVSLIEDVVAGLAAGVEHESIDEGLAGVHLMKSPDKKPRGVFKPRVEEFGCAGNPKGAAVGQELKRGIEPGFGYLRERAAFVVDQRDGGAAGVPVTAVATLPLSQNALPMVGALQEYVEHDCDAEDIGASRFALDEVHNMALLDMRLANCDRHEGNILVQRRARRRSPAASDAAIVALPDDDTDALSTRDDAGEGTDGDDDEERNGEEEDGRSSGGRSSGGRSSGSGSGDELHIVPIDHGCVLPTELADLYFGWQYWPQASQPLSAATRARVAAIDPAADMAAVRAAVPGLPAEALLVGEICGTLVQRACGIGQLSVRAAANLMTRGINDQPSVLEQLCARAAASVSGDALRSFHAGDWCRDANARSSFLATLRSEIDGAVGSVM